ncbi:MAG: hypothetical protein AAF492_08340, partial [Verrucomicrobiota bacterium]
MMTLLVSAHIAHADLDILVIGSTQSYSDGGESGVVQEQAFDPSGIATQLQSILDNDSAVTGTANVVFQDIYTNKSLWVNYSGGIYTNFTSHCYSLAQFYMWPEGKADRLAELRGTNGTAWDYVVVMAGSYMLANFPGMYAEGAQMIIDEVRSGTAEPILFASWPENSSTFTADDFNEVVSRIGDSAEVRVVPGGKSWDSLIPQDSAPSHPTPDGAYLAAAGIYSTLFDRSAETSDYTYDDAIADHALDMVRTNASMAQYSGDYTNIHVFAMKYVSRREVKFRETGTSTEDRIRNALDSVESRYGVSLITSGPFWDFNYGRGNDWWEDNKDYEVNTNLHDRAYGFPMHHYRLNSASNTMPYGIDKHYHMTFGYEDGTDLGIAYNMIRPGTRELSLPYDVRAIPIRLMWLKMREQSPGFNPLGDNTHMNNRLNDATAAFMYTLLSGRCPIVDEPSPQGSSAWLEWLGHKTGYETAWQMSHITTRTPGFQVLPTAWNASNVTPTVSQTLSVRFWMAPTSDVTVTISSDDPFVGIASPAVLTFTPVNYSNAQVVTVQGESGPAGTYAFDVTLTTSSDDPTYESLRDSWDFSNTRPEGPPPSSIQILGNGIQIVSGSTNP